MANKKILVSDGNGRYQETSASIDDNNVLSASISTLTASFQTTVTGIMQVYNYQLIPFWMTSSIPSYLRDSDNNPVTPNDLSGCLFQVRTDIGEYAGIGPHRIDSASFSGDIAGTLSSSFPIRVISVGNVNSGTLDSKFGGTSTSSFNVDSLVTLSGSGIKPDGTNDTKIVVATTNNTWTTQSISYTNFTPLTSSIVYLFTGSTDSNGAQYNWNKPSGCRFIRVICQGGGGGGGRGRHNLSIAQGGGVGGAGGGGGGYSDITFNANSINSTIIITVGSGGTGGTGASGTGTAGTGQSSSFGNYVYANGGGGGSNGIAAATTPGGSGGTGYTLTGNDGGDYNQTLTNASRYYGAGGGGGGGLANDATSTSTNGRSGSGNLIVNGAPGGATKTITSGGSGNAGSGSYTVSYFNFKNYYLNGTSSINLQQGNFPNLIAGGGGGGGAGNITTGAPLENGGAGGNGKFGAGGGGSSGGIASEMSSVIGSSGGAGYVLIICT